MSELITIRTSRAKAGKLARLTQALRSYWTGSFSLKDPALNELYGIGRRTQAGPVVTELTAFTCAAFWDGVNQIATDVAKLPLNLHKRRNEGGSELFTDSHTYKMLRWSPNPETRSMVFRRTMTAHALVYGNAYAQIIRDASGRPRSLWMLHPTRVQPFYDREGASSDGRRNPLRYRVDGTLVLSPEEIIHIPGLSDDGVEGANLVGIAREAIGLSLASQQFAASFFGNGTRFGGIISSDAELDDEQKEGVLKSIEKLHASADKAFRLLVLANGFKFTESGVKPSDAEMTKIRDQQVTEIARYLNMPLHKLKLAIPGAVSYASVEMADLDYYKGPILNWTRLWEEELDAKLIPSLELGRQYFKHNVNAFLRGDIKSRYDALGIARDKGIINADEWRELEDMNPQPDGQGKVYLVQSAQIPVNKLSELVDAQIKETNFKATPPPVSPNDEQVRVARERAERAEALADRAEQEAQAAREALAAAEASGTARAEELKTLRETLRESQTQATNLTVLAAELRERVELVQTAKDITEQEARALAEAKGSAEAQSEAAREAVKAAELAKVAAEHEAAEAITRESDARRLADEQAALAVEAQTLAATAVTDKAEALRKQAEAAALAREAWSTADDARQAREAYEAEAREALATLELLKAEAADLASRLEQEADARSTAERSIGELSDTLTATQDAEQRAREARDAVEVEREAARQEAETLAAARQSLEQQIALLQGALSETQTSHEAQLAALRDALARMEQQRAAGEADRVALAQRAEAAEQATRAHRQAEIARLQGTLTAHRALVVDAMGRMVTKETDRARKNQATPAKLTNWLKNFDALHAEYCVVALLPAVRAHLAWTQSEDDPRSVTEALVAKHLVDFRDKLTAVADGDGGDFHAILAKTLERWEAEQPARIADQLMHEAIAYLRAVEKT